MRDLFTETFASLRAHRLRFGLAALGVGWGALMLTFLSAQSGAMAAANPATTKEVWRFIGSVLLPEVRCPAYADARRSSLPRTART